MNLEYLVVPGKARICLKNDGGISKGNMNQFEGTPDSQIWDNLSNTITIVIDYNP